MAQIKTVRRGTCIKFCCPCCKGEFTFVRDTMIHLAKAHPAWFAANRGTLKIGCLKYR